MTAETPENHPLVPTQGSETMPPVVAATLCVAVKADGSPCRSRPQPSSAYCWFHDPALAERRSEVGRMAAATSHRRTCLTPGSKAPQLQSAEDVRTLLSEIVHQLRTGVIDRATANGLTYACQIALRTIDARDLQRRIEALETAAKARR